MKHFLKWRDLHSFAAVLAILLTLAALGPWFNAALSWDRNGLQHLQIWRLITGHWVHTNLSHGLLNCAALAMAGYFFGHAATVKQWLLHTALLCLFISACLFFFDPWLMNYVGFSGVLYGIFALGLLQTIRQHLWLNSLLLLALSWKVIAQQMPGFDSEYLRATIEASVIVKAHFYGYLGGILLGLNHLRITRQQQKHSGFKNT